MFTVTCAGRPADARLLTVRGSFPRSSSLKANYRHQLRTCRSSVGGGKLPLTVTLFFPLVKIRGSENSALTAIIPLQEVLRRYMWLIWQI